MKTGLGLYRKYRNLIAWINLFRFTLRKCLIGFDSANLFLQHIDKFSVLLILKKNGASIGKNVDIETGLIFHNCRNYKNLFVGDNSHIGKNCFFDLRDRIAIGNNVVISMQCTFITHIDLSKSMLSSIYPAKSSPISIGDNSYLGAKTTLIKGLGIGKNVIVAAGAIVNKSVENNVVVGGLPASLIKNLEIE